MILRTKRLIIRAYEEKDAEAIYGVINDPTIYEMTLHIPYPYPREQVEIWIGFVNQNRRYRRGFEWGIFDLSGCYLGNIGLVNIDYINRSGEITYFVGKDFRKQGIATEAVGGVLKYAFEILHLERVAGRCMLENKASISVMGKNGIRFEGIARHEVMKDSVYRDIWHGGLLRNEYVQNRA